MTKVPFKTEELEAGDIISLRANLPKLNGHEYSRLYIFEVTKRLFKTVVLFDVTANWKPGSIYNFQIIDFDNQSDKWVKLV